MIRGIIFDYDGTLVDTESLWVRACLATLKEFNVSVPEHEYENLIRPSVSAYMVKTYNLPASAETIRNKNRVFFEHLSASGIKAMPGAVELVKRISPRFPLAVGSASTVERIQKTLNTLALDTYFSAIIGGDMVENSKPDPETFLKAAEAIGIPPQDCLVIEDTVYGLEAAKAAGMKCIVIPNKDIPLADFSAADKILDSLELVTDELIESLK